jgi:hypothetical protein
MTKFLATLLVLSGLGTVLVAADLSGAWKLFLDPDLGGVRNTVPCTFTQDGQKLTIICNGDTAAPIFGEINGRRVTFRLKTGNHNEATVTHGATGSEGDDDQGHMAPFEPGPTDQGREIRGTEAIAEGRAPRGLRGESSPLDVVSQGTACRRLR